MRIADVMTQAVQCISPQHTVEEAAQIMAEFDVGAIPVVVDDEAVGVVTDRDIAIRAVARGRSPSSTTVEEVMSPRVVACHPEDSLEQAAVIMEEEQVRRLLVIDDDGCVCGIVSLGDLALRTHDDELAEEVLEQVSLPGHSMGGSLLSGLFRSEPRSAHGMRRSRNGSSAAVGSVAALAAGFCAGACAMYLMDPDRGRRRRAVIRDKMIRTAHVAQDRLAKTARYTQGKTRGLVSETRSMLRRNHHHVDDAKLRERVRSVLGRVVSHPHSITVESNDGVITLSGTILVHEVPGLMAAVNRVPGVRDVENFLDAHPTRGNEPSLQGGLPRHRRRGPMQDNWSPTTRLLGLLGAGALMGLGMVRRDPLSLAGAAAGIGLAARSFTNLPTRRLIGIGAGRRAVDVQKDININAPVDQVFDFFSKYRNFPHFMSCVREVRDHGNGRSHWVVKGPAGMNVTWDADLTIFERNKVIGWRSVPGSMVENAGIIRFEPNDNDGTRVNIKLSYNPPGGALGHAMAMLFGADAKSELDADLLRAKTLIETGHPAHDAAQPSFGGTSRLSR